MPVTEREVIEARAGRAIRRDGVVDALAIARHALEELLDAAVSDADAHVIAPAELGCEVLGDVAEGVPFEERACEERYALADDHRLSRAEEVDVARALPAPESAAVDGVRAERVVVARQEVDRHRDLGHRFEGAVQRRWTQPVVLEDVAGDDDELGVGLAGDVADLAERLETLRAHEGAGIAGDEARAKAELPISGVDEAGGWRHGEPTRWRGRPPAIREAGASRLEQTPWFDRDRVVDAIRKVAYRHL
jgi:hypothetical protein